MTTRLSALCIDAHDTHAVAQFWATALGRTLEDRHDGGWVVRHPGEVPIWVDPVPEGKTVKNRVHPDLRAASLRALTDIGAIVQTSGDHHHVLTDPEGNEFCVFDPLPGESSPGQSSPGQSSAGQSSAGQPSQGQSSPGQPPPGQRPPIHFSPGTAAPAEMFAVCVDSDRPEMMAQWWRDRLGGQVGPGPDGTLRWIHGAAGFGAMALKFVRVHDRRVTKNRWHWDVETDELAALCTAGAAVIRRPDDIVMWTVMQDPDGNEFCAFDMPTLPTIG